MKNKMKNKSIAVSVICFLDKANFNPSAIGCVGLYEDMDAVFPAIQEHAVKTGRNPITDYTVFRGLVEPKDKND